MPRRTPPDPRFGQRMRTLREQHALSFRELGRLTLASKSKLHKIETGMVAADAETATRLDDALGAGGELTAMVRPAAVQLPQDTVTPTPAVDLAAHWRDMLRVLTAADNALGGHGLLNLVSTELQLIDSQRETAARPARTDLTVVAARWREFGSWICDNEGHDQQAGRWLEAAGSMAREAGDVTLTAYVGMRRAQRAVEKGQVGAAEALVQPVLGAGGLPPRVRALAAVRLAQAHAHHGDATGTRRSIGTAFRLVDQSAAEDPQTASLVSHCTSVYVRAYEACCRLLLGEPAAAIHDFETVLADWPHHQRLDEGFFRAHFAVALHLAGDVDAARDHAAAARELGLQTGSQRTLSLVTEVAADRTATVPVGGHPATRVVAGSGEHGRV
nr:helix-turn-helix transcriptional regulator [Natronosporangium hydrolyticum]